MAGRLSKFLALGGPQKRMFLAAFFVLGRIRLELNRKSFNLLVADFECYDGNEPAERVPVNAESTAVANEVGRAVRSAAGHTPWESTCLVQVLAAQRMLESRGVSGEFFLGARRDARASDSDVSDFRAHAWLTSGGRFVTGEAEHEHYRVLACYRW